jgi:membrane-associated phospholipid phosphatase
MLIRINASKKLWIFSVALCIGYGIFAGFQGGFQTAQAFSQRLPEVLWEQLTFLGDERIILAVLLPFSFRYPALFRAVVVAALVGGLLGQGIKQLFPLPRPAGVLPADELITIGHILKQRSFPSGHSISIAGLAGVVWGLFPPKVAFPVLLLAAGVGFSRVAVGAHWPFDVLVGLSLGFLSALLGLKAVSPRWDGWLRWGVLIAIGTLANQGDSATWLLSLGACLWGIGGFFWGLWRQRVGADPIFMEP